MRTCARTPKPESRRTPPGQSRIATVTKQVEDEKDKDGYGEKEGRWQQVLAQNRIPRFSSRAEEKKKPEEGHPERSSGQAPGGRETEA